MDKVQLIAEASIIYGGADPGDDPADKPGININ